MTYAAPHSYTGEDTIEFLLPGNPALLERVLARLTESEGVRRAGPGEFTARAYLNGRLSLDQAEGVAMTITARNEEELNAAQRVLRGAAGARYDAIAESIAQALALVEAGIDFTDQEDVVAIAPNELCDRLTVIATSLQECLGGIPQRERSGTARVVLVGRPNAGKSTLFNALLGRERAVVSDVAGTTRDAVVERVDLSDAAPGAGEIELVDLAGLDESLTHGIDHASQAAALRAIGEADAIIHCDPDGRFDVKFESPHAPTLRVRTKADLPTSSPMREELAVCALDGWNLSALKRAIADAAGGSASSAMAARHSEALRNANRTIIDARDRVSAQQDVRHLEDVEILAMNLREALDHVGSITGRVTPDDVIGRIFASFCIGK